MSNIDFSTRHGSFGPDHTGSAPRTSRQKIQGIVNVALIAAAFLFVGAAVIGLFP